MQLQKAEKQIAASAHNQLHLQLAQPAPISDAERVSQ